MYNIKNVKFWHQPFKLIQKVNPKFQHDQMIERHYHYYQCKNTFWLNNNFIITENYRMSDSEQEIEHFDKSTNITGFSAGFHSIGFEKFERKSQVFNANKNLYLMQIDIDSYIEEGDSIIRIYGVTEDGNSIQCHVKGFDPYLYVGLPTNTSLTKQELNIITQKLNKKGAYSTQSVKCAKRIEIVEKQSIRFFQNAILGKPSSKFLKIYLYNPDNISKVRRIFQDGGLTIGNQIISGTTYQSNIPFELRYMIDHDIVGMGWIHIPANTYSIRNSNDYVSLCQLEIDCNVNSISSVYQDKWNKIAPLRLLSFDIQCDNQKNISKDAIITIACICKISTQKVQNKIIFTLKSCAAIPNVKVQSCQNEEQLLLKFQNLIKSYDPDFLVGYNIINFDLKYILARAEVLKLKNFGYFGRSKIRTSKMKESKYYSKIMGMRQTKKITTGGRIQLDLMIHMQKQHKLTSYSAHNVSELFLQSKLEDISHLIHQLFVKSPQGRQRIALNCLKNAEVSIKLIDRLMCLYNYTEMARVTGVPINYLFTRGQQIKVFAQLVKKANRLNLIVPHEKVKGNGDDVNFQGAYVIEPKIGFYNSPIINFDFESFYPNLMMSHNLCYSTLITKSQIEKLQLKMEDVIETTEKCYFVKQHIRKGILPSILEQLITARKKTKKQLANTNDQMLKAVLQGRQLALKISANSVYGFTGTSLSQLACFQISSSVTGFGRKYLDQAKTLAQQKYQVIYGDTDSLLLKFNSKYDNTITQKKIIIAQAIQCAKQIAYYFSKHFPKLIKLEYKKIFYPYLILSKKRYAGLTYTNNPQKYDNLQKKGIQSVRRDNCLLIRDMIENILIKILKQDNPSGCVQYIKTIISNLLQNKIDINSLIITKSISKNTRQQQDQQLNTPKKSTYKTKQAHVQLSQKMKKRDPSLSFQIGDRIPYIMIKGAKGSKNFQNSEDPVKVLNEDLPIDYDYYIQKQIKPPLERLLKGFNIVPDFDKLFSGQHTKLRYIPKINQSSALGKFFKVCSTCTNCKTVTKNALCQKCQPNMNQIFENKIRQFQNMKDQYEKIYNQCQSCQGNSELEVICQNKDCQIFYKRIKLCKELKIKEENIKRFDL